MRGLRKTARTVSLAAALTAAASLVPAWAPADSGHGYASKYAGQERREIKTLSEEDVRELRAGGGWGLAKAAELNGLPGPKHILEMSREIGLSPEQERMVAELYRDMKEKAVALGGVLIQRERDLNRAFASGEIDEASLGTLLNAIADTYRDLRFAHLSAHLRTPDILTEEQVREYNRLRGYSLDDPCARVPEGHDPAMWRKHNDCD